VKLLKQLSALKYWFAGGVLIGAVVLVIALFFIPSPTKPSQAVVTTTITKPSPTPEPTNTSQPTVTPVPTPTLKPTPTPTPIPTPTPTPIPFNNRFSYQTKDIVEQVRPGVIHIKRTQYNPGPMNINILLFDITAPEFDLRVALRNDYLSGVLPTSQFLKTSKGALAAVNGDLFSGQGLPQGLVITDGRLAMAPKHRATFAWTKDRQPWIGYFTSNWTWPATVTEPGGEKHSIELMNNPCQQNWLCIYNYMIRTVSGNYGDIKVLIGADNTVEEIDEEGKQLKIPDGSNILLARQGSESARWLKKYAEVGKPLTIAFNVTPGFDNLQQAVSGGPIFLQNGKFVQDCLCYLGDCSKVKEKIYQGPLCEEFDLEWKYSHYLTIRMPRTGVGFNTKKDLLVVAQVDGYQPGFSIGITQKEFADLFTEFGATTAMELDGGGSSTMALNGKLASRPGDGSGAQGYERAVPNAVLFYWRDKPVDSRQLSSR
jgi:hypothetical protein